ncbi:MAG: hypothetical protein U0264_04505 [Candidatus Kapaibacterium sp.]
MATIYCTQKLKDYIPSKIVQHEVSMPAGEEWNANLFTINRSKCIAFMHKETVYVVVLFDVTKKDIPTLEHRFTEAYIAQLYSDNILKKEQEPAVREQLGAITFRPTDNDRSTLGSLKDTLYRITFYDDGEPDFIERVKQYVATSTNRTPMGSKKYKSAVTLMQDKLNHLLSNDAQA